MNGFSSRGCRNISSTSLRYLGRKYSFYNCRCLIGTEFVSYNELNLIKCVNINLKGKGISILQSIKGFGNSIQAENLNIFFKLWLNYEAKDQKLATQKLFEAITSVKDLGLLSEIIQFQRFLMTPKALFQPELTENYLAQALQTPSYLNKELLIYLIQRDSRLFELKTELSKLQIQVQPQQQFHSSQFHQKNYQQMQQVIPQPNIPVRVFRYFLPSIIEKHPVVVSNLLKDIEGESPSIYLALKTKLRALGLYNEEFSIQSMIYREDKGEKGVKYRQIEKSEIIKIIQKAQINDVNYAAEAPKFVDILEEWQQLFTNHEPLQVAQLTLESIPSFIRRDHKVEQHVYDAIRIPYLRQQSCSLLEQMKEYEQQFLTLRAFAHFNIPSLIHQRVDLARLWVQSINHIYEYEIQRLHNQMALIKQSQSANIFSKLLQQDNSLDILHIATQNLVSLYLINSYLQQKSLVVQMLLETLHICKILQTRQTTSSLDSLMNDI